VIQQPYLSVVFPVFNEEENVPVLLEEIAQALRDAGWAYEIVAVDDGSKDRSLEVLRASRSRYPNLRVLAMEKNSGQTAALDAGWRAARGTYVVSLDADLQNDPADLPRVLGALDGADVVSGVRAVRNDRWVRRISSRIANAVRRRVLKDPVTDIGCSFKAYRRDALEGLPMFVGAHRFLPALCVFRGAKLVEVQLAHRPRRHGHSKYGIGNRLWRGITDLVGVHWLKSRLILYRVREPGRPPAP
jgi:glycosyltransferase involved in cell wall biosynthesis